MFNYNTTMSNYNLCPIKRALLRTEVVEAHKNEMGQKKMSKNLGQSTFRTKNSTIGTMSNARAHHRMHKQMTKKHTVPAEDLALHNVCI